MDKDVIYLNFTKIKQYQYLTIAKFLYFSI